VLTSNKFWPGMPFMSYDFWLNIDIKGRLVAPSTEVVNYWTVSIQFIRDRREVPNNEAQWVPVHYLDVPFSCPAVIIISLMPEGRMTEQQLDEICTNLLREVR